MFLFIVTGFKQMSLYSDSPSARAALTATFSLFVTACVVGNSLVILVLLREKSSRTPMNFLLVNLAVADMLVGIFIAPRFVFLDTFTHPHGTSGTWLCKIITGGNITWTAGACSVFTLVAIAFERYYAIMYPYSDRGKMTIKKLNIIITACWFGAIVLNIPLYLTIYFDEKKDFCFEYWPQKWLPVAYATVWWTAAGVFPIFSMSLLYSRVIYHLWNQTEEHSSSTQLALLRYRKKVTKMMVTVSVVYAICWIPILTTYMLSYAHPNFNYGDVTHISSMVLTCLNSTINPFIYTFHKQKFRKMLKKTVCCLMNRIDDQSSAAPASNTGRRSRMQEDEAVPEIES